MTTFLAVACVILLVLLVCGGLAAFDLITQLDEDHEAARTDRDDYKQRLEQMSAKCIELTGELADLNDYATCLEAMVGTVEQPARHLKAVPTVANVIDLIARNEATRDLPNLNTWLDGWDTNGDPA